MIDSFEHLEPARILGPRGERCGAFRFDRGNAKLAVIVSDGDKWDHVSVSLATRCPTWEEMCFIKKLFFKPEEAVMQLHPPATEYVNCHPYCLHLWRPQTEKEMAAVKSQWEAAGEDYLAPGMGAPQGRMLGVVL